MIFFSIKYTKNIPNVEAVLFVFGTMIFFLNIIAKQ